MEATYMVLLKINGIDMPDPQKYSFPMQDTVVESLYNGNGILFRNRIRQGICSIELALMATSEQATILLSAIEPDMVTVESE